MQNVLVTGASGRLGGKFVKLLLETTDFHVIGAASTIEKFSAMEIRENITKTERLTFLPNNDLVSTEFVLPDLYGAVHFAFSRRNQPASRIADSIEFSANVFEKLASSTVKKVINISSQGVYGSTEEIRTEETPAAPDNHYTMAKYATEVIFNTIFSGYRDKKYTNLRLDIVAQSNNLVQALCKQAREGTIHLRGGEQVFSFIDEEDAVGAVMAMLVSEGAWEKKYNVGWNRKRYTLLEIADEVSDAAEECGISRPTIHLDKQDIKLWAGMDSSRFMEFTEWKPGMGLKESCKKMLMNIED